MALTNKEIINSQVKRINNKTNTTHQVYFHAHGRCFLVIKKDGGETKHSPFDPDITTRTTSQMIEYLAGVENTIDYFKSLQ